MKPSNVRIEITLKSLLLITFFIIGVILLWRLKIILFFLFFAFILSSALRPYVDYFETKKVPRIVTTLAIFVVLLLALSLMTVTFLSSTMVQLKNLIVLMPQLISNVVAESFEISPWLRDIVNLQDFKTELIKELTGLMGAVGGGLGSAYTVINSAVSSVGSLATVIMLSLYMLVRKEEVYLSIISSLPVKSSTKKSYIERLKLVENKLGDWVRAQLFAMLVIGVLTWFGLVTPSIFLKNYNLGQYALSISFIAGILEAVPTLGPILTAVFAVIIALGSGAGLPTIIYIVFIFYLIQQLESAVIFPKIMSKVVGMDPIVTIVSVISAYMIFGMLGSIFIIPIIAVAKILFSPELHYLVDNGNQAGKDKVA